MKILIYGDIGGCLDEFIASLERHGCFITPSGIDAPDDVVIIQVGDLIDRGPKSNELVALVHKTLRYQAEQTERPRWWIQLFGNHEGNQIGGARFSGYDDYTDAKAKKRLRKWWDKKLAFMAVGVETAEGPWLITHAGMSVSWWKSYGLRYDLAENVKLLNGESLSYAFLPGNQLEGWAHHGPAGVAWADCMEHVYAQWARWAAQGKAIPFNQVHGHSSAHKWGPGTTNPWMKVLRSNAKKEGLSMTFKADGKRRFTICTIGGSTFYGIDQKLGKGDLWFDVEPLVLEGELVLPRE